MVFKFLTGTSKAALFNVCTSSKSQVIVIVLHIVVVPAAVTISFIISLFGIYAFNAYLNSLIWPLSFGYLEFFTSFPGHINVVLAPVAQFCGPILPLCYCPFLCDVLEHFLFMSAVLFLVKGHVFNVLTLSCQLLKYDPCYVSLSFRFI
jgi:hypothetical protein